jgi:hypothetical protein
MSYNGSKAVTGAGSTLSIGTTPVLIGEITSLKLSGRKFGTDNATNMSSTVEEFIATIADMGEWACDFNRVSSDAGQIALEAAFAAGQLNPFTIQLEKTPTQTTSGDSYTFKALITECDYSFEPTKKQVGSCKLKISGGLTPVTGS